jgi:uncharacterized membrane protein (UPF0127 family)
MTFFDRRAALGVLSCLALLAACAAPDKGAAAEPAWISPLEDLSIVSANGVHSFKVEIADDEAERQHGLMDRPSMPRDHGMLFEFQDNRDRSFWMHNTHIPLDIIYIGRDGRIVSIAANATPFSETPIPSEGPATGVLELNGGQAAALGIKPGDRVRHPFFAGR